MSSHVCVCERRRYVSHLKTFESLGSEVMISFVGLKSTLSVSSP